MTKTVQNRRRQTNRFLFDAAKSPGDSCLPSTKNVQNVSGVNRVFTPKQMNEFERKKNQRQYMYRAVGLQVRMEAMT